MSTNVWVRHLHGQRAFVQIFPRAHPAPLPDLSSAQCPDLKRLPPKPKLKIKAVANGELETLQLMFRVGLIVSSAIVQCPKSHLNFE